MRGFDNAQTQTFCLQIHHIRHALCRRPLHSLPASPWPPWRLCQNVFMLAAVSALRSSLALNTWAQPAQVSSAQGTTPDDYDHSWCTLEASFDVDEFESTYLLVLWLSTLQPMTHGTIHYPTRFA